MLCRLLSPASLSLILCGLLAGCAREAPPAKPIVTGPDSAAAQQAEPAAPAITQAPSAQPAESSAAPAAAAPPVTPTPPVATAPGNAPPPAPPARKFPLEFRIVDPDNPANAALAPGAEPLPPLIVMFPGGKTAGGDDVRAALGRLEGFRGASKLLPKSNDDPGLPVLMCGLRFAERLGEDGTVIGHDVELQGEHNAVKVPAPREAMDKLLAGEPAAFELESKLNYGLIATVSTTRMTLALNGDELKILAVTGGFTFRELLTTYVSAPLEVQPPAGRDFLYRGELAPLPEKPILTGLGGK